VSARSRASSAGHTTSGRTPTPSQELPSSGCSALATGTASSKAFSLSGTADGELRPGGAASPVDLLVTNPNNRALRVTNFRVTVTGSSRAACAATDFAVRQYAGWYPLTVAAKASGVHLTSLGVPASALPTVTMLDGARNQDACKGVTVHLAYTGSATNQ